MSLFQFNQFSTVIFTTNIDPDTGAINTTGFTKDNTREIEVIKDSFVVDQTVSEAYIESSNLLDTTTYADKISSVNVPEGSFSLSIYFNSSANGPHSPLLWKSLINKPLEQQEGYIEQNLFREDTYVPVFGIIVVSNGITYLIENCRTQSVELSTNIQELVTLNWSGNFTSFKILGKTTITEDEENSEYALSGALTGVMLDDKLSNYTLCMSKLTKVGISKTGELAPQGYIAFTDFNINIANELLFVENKGIDRTTLNQIFVGTKKFDITGSATFYTRNAGYAYDLVKDIIDSRNPDYTEVDIDNRTKYKLFIYLTKPNDDPLAEIIIDGLTMTVSVELGQIFSNTISFKLSETENSVSSAIKFYH